MKRMNGFSIDPHGSEQALIDRCREHDANPAGTVPIHVTVTEEGSQPEDREAVITDFGKLNNGSTDFYGRFMEGGHPTNPFHFVVAGNAPYGLRVAPHHAG